MAPGSRVFDAEDARPEQRNTARCTESHSKTQTRQPLVSKFPTAPLVNWGIGIGIGESEFDGGSYLPVFAFVALRIVFTVARLIYFQHLLLFNLNIYAACLA